MNHWHALVKAWVNEGLIERVNEWTNEIVKWMSDEWFGFWVPIDLWMDLSDRTGPHLNDNGFARWPVPQAACFVPVPKTALLTALLTLCLWIWRTQHKSNKPRLQNQTPWPIYNLQGQKTMASYLNIMPNSQLITPRDQHIIPNGPSHSIYPKHQELTLEDQI